MRVAYPEIREPLSPAEAGRLGWRKAQRRRARQGEAIADGSVEAGLLCLGAMASPGEAFTLDEIAQACGVSWQRIWQIEKEALRKIRKRLSAGEAMELRNFLQT